MKQSQLLRLGILGTVVAAVCCFTPLLVVLLASIGLSAWAGYLDIVLLPALVFFMSVVVYALLKNNKLKESEHDKSNHS
ncbi:MAG: mercury resistance system transport protein MerF [Ghiorsea sp.]|nr:mercury resistance system transport protein MerF [Ghiorsea sp.]